MLYILNIVSLYVVYDVNSCRFTKSGVFLECVFWDDVEKLVDGYNSDIKESRKSK